MIPMADETPVRRTPWATILLILICCAVYFAVQPGSQTLDQIINPGVDRITSDQLRFMVDHAAIPCEITQGRPLTNREFRDTYGFGETSSCNHGNDESGSHDPGKSVYLALLLSLFLHGSPQHLFGNMLFLWVFGTNLEDRQGRLRYLALYLVAGIVATFAHVLSDPNSTVPIIGASGAIAGVMGAYLVCYPAARVKSVIFFGPVLLRKVRASWLLVLWFAQQFLLVGSGIAYAAHIGGFAFGALVGLFWRWRDRRDGRALPPPAEPEPAAALG
jgi:membrane associated rhomboid family serine protease